MPNRARRADPGYLTSMFGRGSIDAGDRKEGPMARMMADCRRWPSETNCSLVIIGEEDEVVQTAAEHAASVHGHENNEEMRAQLRDFLEPADQYTPERQAEGALPG
jgi:predicted small metal-binding protein